MASEEPKGLAVPIQSAVPSSEGDASNEEGVPEHVRAGLDAFNAEQERLLEREIELATEARFNAASPAAREATEHDEKAIAVARELATSRILSSEEQEQHDAEAHRAAAARAAIEDDREQRRKRKAVRLDDSPESENIPSEIRTEIERIRNARGEVSAMLLSKEQRRTLRAIRSVSKLHAARRAKPKSISACLRLCANYLSAVALVAERRRARPESVDVLTDKVWTAIMGGFESNDVARTALNDLLSEAHELALAEPDADARRQLVEEHAAFILRTLEGWRVDRQPSAKDVTAAILYSANIGRPRKGETPVPNARIALEAMIGFGKMRADARKKSTRRARAKQKINRGRRDAP